MIPPHPAPIFPSGTSPPPREDWIVMLAEVNVAGTIEPIVTISNLSTDEEPPCR